MMQRTWLTLDHGMEAQACVILVTLLSCVTLGVITRELDDPLIRTNEISRFLMVRLAVFGWILASRRRTHVRIRFFQELLPGGARKTAEFVIQFALLVFGIGVAIHSLSLTIRNFDLEATTAPTSFAWLYAPMVLAGITTAGQALSEITELGRRDGDLSTADESAVEWPL